MYFGSCNVFWQLQCILAVAMYFWHLQCILAVAMCFGSCNEFLQLQCILAVAMYFGSCNVFWRITNTRQRDRSGIRVVQGGPSESSTSLLSIKLGRITEQGCKKISAFASFGNRHLPKEFLIARLFRPLAHFYKNHPFSNFLTPKNSNFQNWTKWT